MSIIAIVLLVALLIPIMAILFDSPIGRALARRLEGPERLPAGLDELSRKIELLENEVEDLTRIVQNLQDDNAFFQRMLEDAAQRPTLPPPPSA
jgi:hypothetical protein